MEVNNKLRVNVNVNVNANANACACARLAAGRAWRHRCRAY